MRRALWLLIAVFGFSASAMAQPESVWGEDSVQCRDNLYIYYELARNKNYVEAYDSWKYVYDNCPRVKEFNMIYGPYIVEAMIKNTEDAAQKEEYKQLLFDVYESRLKYFPGKEGYVYGRMALDAIQHYPDSSSMAIKYFKKSLETGGKEQSAAFYNGYFIAAARLFNDDIYEIKDVFNVYNEVSEGISFNTDKLNRTITTYSADPDDSTATEPQLSDKETKELAKAKRELERYDDVESNIGKILGPIATCDKLATIYNAETFEENKNDTIWLRRAATMLTRERTNDEGESTNCTDNPIFIDVAEALYKLQPSTTAARAVGLIAYKNDNFSKATEYLTEAAEREVDRRAKAKDYIRLATIYQKRGQLANAKSAALKAARYDESSGKPYLILASIYGQADGLCGSNVFEKKAVYWAAINKAKYARSIDKSVASQASRMIAAFKQQLPDKTIIFQLGVKEGDKHNIGCFINETITVDYNL